MANNPVNPISKDKLLFRVLSVGKNVPSEAVNQAFLVRDNWDDWNKYCTQFSLKLADAEGKVHDIGDVKIGEVGLKPYPAALNLPAASRMPAIKGTFPSLGDEFFSLGQEEEYYEKLSSLGDEMRVLILQGLRDIAFDQALWDRHKNETVSGESLLRFVSESTVNGQFRRMAHGGARLTKFRFSYSPPKRESDGPTPYKLDFEVIPERLPPMNVHVLIGRNGVGKTRLLVMMAKALIGAKAVAGQSGSFVWSHKTNAGDNFANLVFVSFSAFDEADCPPLVRAEESRLKYSYVGLRRANDAGEKVLRSKSPATLATEFVKSLAACQRPGIKRRWLATLAVLKSDPVFHSANLEELIEFDVSDANQKRQVLDIFKRLSSGHKIVLLTITRLVETVEEKTLVLIDEPEAHLHPPLLSAFIRALSSLLVDRNGVAIVASHSPVVFPVVLQEVPKSCVWILNRAHSQSKAERPNIETFAENVGVLSREVFQLELTQSGFHQLLRDAVSKAASYEAALDLFDGEVGAEGRAILRALYLVNERQES